MTVEEAARQYVRARAQAIEATGPAATQYQLAADDAYHELAAALGEPCPCCDPGTCPLDTEAL